MIDSAKTNGAPVLLLRPTDAAKALAISAKTLWSLSEPRGPIPVVRIGERSIRYSVAALEKWIAAAQTATAEANGEIETEVRGSGARLAPVGGWTPSRAAFDSPALHTTKNERLDT